MGGITKDYSNKWIVGPDEKDKTKRYKTNNKIHFTKNIISIIRIPHKATKKAIMDLGTNTHLRPKISQRRVKTEEGTGIEA